MSRPRELRKTQTAAEREMWELLRDRRLRDLKFRRQSPISIFVADFYCRELKLVVELDGGVHDTPRQAAHDENRDIYLRSLGCTVLRFSNRQVFEEANAVLEKIVEVAASIRGILTPRPPLPPGEGAGRGEAR
jgi:very-short-patch-repair endonuclease